MTVQVAVKLPEALAVQLDELVQSGDFESRSQALRLGLETILVEREREQLRARYRDAFAQHPETAQEIAEAMRLAREAIEEEPWERWW
jgi:Arc/MetJ-type ribon-helix-helix transcriptional regulator